MKLFSRNAKYYEWLPAYLEGGLDEARQAQMQARLAADPALAAEAERLRPALAALKASAAREQIPANSAVPADLWPRLQRRLERDAAPRPIRQIGWMAGVGATAALALAAALWLPMGFSSHRGENVKTAGAKIAKTNPPVEVAMTPPKAPIRPAARPAPAISAAPAVTRPVQVAQAGGPLTPNSGGTSVVSPSRPVPTGSPELGRGGFSGTFYTASRLPPKPAAVKPAPAAKPTLMASRLGGIQNGDLTVNGGLTVSVNGLSPLAPPADAPAPASLARDSLNAPSAPPMTAFKAVAPAGSDAGQVKAAPLSKAFSLPSETKSGVAAVAQTVPQAAPPVSSLTVPRFQSRMPRLGGIGGMKAAAPPVSFHALSAEAVPPPSGQSLDTWMAALSAAVQPPLWGEDAGAAQANQTLTAARQAGQLEALRSRLETRRAQSPQDIPTGRMLAAVYELGFGNDLALSERRRIAGLAGAGGEDWFALAQAEDHAGSAQAAKLDYQRALESPVPPNSLHAALARQKQSGRSGAAAQ